MNLLHILSQSDEILILNNFQQIYAADIIQFNDIFESYNIEANKEDEKIIKVFVYKSIWIYK